MSTFAPWKMITVLPIDYLKDYSNSSGIIVLKEFDWQKNNMPEEILKKDFYKTISNLDANAAAQFKQDFETVFILSSEAGIRCLLNASEQPETLEEKFASLNDPCTRSMFIFLYEKEILNTALSLSYTEFKREGRYWQHVLIDTEASLNIDSINCNEAKQNFALKVGNIIHKRFNNEEEACVEIIPRSLDDSYQINVYINALQSASLEVDSKLLKSTISKKAVLSSIVFHLEDKRIYSVISGGNPAQKKLQEAFTESFFGLKPEFNQIKNNPFKLEVFKHIPNNENNLFKVQAEDPFLESIKLRKVICGGGFYTKTITIPPANKSSSIHGIYELYDPKNKKLNSKYEDIFEISIVFYHKPEKNNQEGKKVIVNLKNFKETSSSNLKDLPYKIRCTVEKYLKLWGAT
jgi:hypothetical protein